MQWCTQDSAKEGEITKGLYYKCSGVPRIRPKRVCRRLRGSGGVAPSRQRIFAVFTLKTLFLTHFYTEKGHAVSAVTTSVARILQWWEGVENDITFDHTLFAGVDPESFSGVHVILN